MRHFNPGLAVGLLAVFFIAGFSFAQGQGRQGQGTPMLKCQERFDSMDTDHDGQLTKEEFMAAPHPRGHAEQMFKAMDVNGIGYVTKEEFCSGKGRGGGGMGKGMGGNAPQARSTEKTQ